ncbi:MAG: hypothetical protein ABJ239_01120 [Erythrobacter sp.]
MFNIKMLICTLVFLLTGGAAIAQDDQLPVQDSLTYADLVSLSDASDLVIHVEIRRQIEVEAERAPGLAAGFARLYIEARTLALVAGNVSVGESLKYLVDVPRDDRGKAPKLKKRDFLLFAKSVPGRPGEIQLVGSQGQFAYSPVLAARIRPILSDLLSPSAPPVIDGVRDALAVQGNLVGESETQIFLDTADGSPVSLSVLRRPGRPVVWGVSWGEIIDQAARAPEPQTLEWYRLACALPASLPGSAILSREPQARALAQSDYAAVMSQLGPCERTLD